MPDPDAIGASREPTMPPAPDSEGDRNAESDDALRSRWRWVIDRNPMFLLSGVLMLGGCFLVSRHIHEIDPAEAGEGVVMRLLIGLLVVLNLYEFAVIGLGLALAKTRTLVRDARHLLGLALLLLIDAAFVYAELGTLSIAAGLTLAGIASGLAWLKVWLVMRSLRMRMSWPGFGVTLVALSAMYALPIAVRAMAHDGFLTQPQAMAVWCGLGLVVAYYALPYRWVSFGAARSADAQQLQRLVAGGLIVLPAVSLLGHAAAALWVYENTFEPAMLSPVLLGLAAVVLRHHVALGGGQQTAQAATLVVASAIVASLMPGDGLIYESARSTWLSISPLRGVLTIAPLLLAWAWWVGGRGVFGAVNTLLPLSAAMLGHTPDAMLRHARLLIDLMLTAGRHLVPTTKLQWGAIAIASAFGCLLIGAGWSWWRGSCEQSDDSDGELLAGPT